MSGRAWEQSCIEQAQSAVLGTVGPDGRPHLVPIVFVYYDQHLYSAVDQKPKTTRRLRRLSHISQNPSVSVLIDHYDDDWSHLWWIRLDGSARVLPLSQTPQLAMNQLVEKYPAYTHHPPYGPVIEVSITRIISWSASEKS